MWDLYHVGFFYAGIMLRGFTMTTFKAGTRQLVRAHNGCSQTHSYTSHGHNHKFYCRFANMRYSL